MTRYGSLDVTFLMIDGFDVCGLTPVFEDDGLEWGFEDVTPFGARVQANDWPGTAAAAMRQTAFYSDAQGKTLDAFGRSPNLNNVLCYSLAGGAKGSAFVGAVVKKTSHNRTTEPAKFTRAIAEWKCADRDEGKIVADLVERTTGGNTRADSVDCGPASTAGAILYLQCPRLELGGYDDLVVTVKESTTAGSGGTWTTLGAFDALTAVGAQRLAVAGNVKQHLAVDFAWTGSGSAQAADFMVGVARL